MNEQALDMIKELEIKKSPEVQSLEEANQSYTKKQLAHFIERYDLDIAKSWKKDEIVAPLSDWMKETSVALLNTDAALRSFYMQNVQNAEAPFDVYSNDLSETDLERVLLLIEHGLAYNVDGQLWVPEETEEAVSSDVESDDQNAAHEVKEETKAQPKPAKKKRTQTPSPSLSPEEKLAQDKKTRLKYLKKQAKKKKKKK